jgi:LDH2 family malate/lactate/ureidoglycolate dehydrogenase
VEAAIKELKKAPKAKGFDDIYFPGEQSYKLKEENIKLGEIEISDNLYAKLRKLLEQK